MCHSCGALERASVFLVAETKWPALSGVYLDFLSPFQFRYCSSVKAGFVASGLTWKSSVSADISVRDKSKAHDGFVVPLRTVHVDEFSLSFAGNRVCLSLPRYHCAAAAHQIGTERQHWTARYRVPYPTQVSTCADWRWRLFTADVVKMSDSTACAKKKKKNFWRSLKCHIGVSVFCFTLCLISSVTLLAVWFYIVAYVFIQY